MTEDSEKWFKSKEEKGVFEEWERSIEPLSWLSKTTKEEAQLLVKIMIWRYQMLSKELRDLEYELDHAQYLARAAGVNRIQAVKAMQDAIQAKQALQIELDNIKLGLATKSNLSIGRSAGLKHRQTKAKELREQLAKAVDDLFAHGKGWKMSNKQIASFLSQNGFKSHYTHETLLKKIAPLIASAKKREQEKSGL